MTIPSIVFGRCPRCGDLAGGDQGSGADAGGADETGNGYVLIQFRGEWMCHMCKKTILQDEESLDMAQKHVEAEQFRQSAGFRKSIG